MSQQPQPQRFYNQSRYDGTASKLVPEDKVLVAESGILQDADVELLKECGVDAFLIGRALMEAEHPKEVAKRWKA